MNTYTQNSQHEHGHRMSVGDGLIECLHQLHPAVQFERGPAFFLYVAAIGTAIASLVLPLTHRAGGWPALLVSLFLWLAILAGDAMVMAFGTEDWREDDIPEIPAEIAKEPSLPPEVQEALSRSGLGPIHWDLQDSNSVELPSGECWQVSLGKKNHDNANV